MAARMLTLAVVLGPPANLDDNPHPSVIRAQVVVDAFNTVAGIITRHNLMEANLNEVLTSENMKSPEALLTHFIGHVGPNGGVV